jgi:ascorbate-specific PTS system EIIC-type component UlaA
LGVKAIRVVVDLTAIVVEGAARGLVDEVVPGAVEAGDGAVVYSYE